MTTINSTSFLTDRYEFTMLQAAIENGKAFDHTVFELFARRLPRGRRYGVVGGTNRAIEAVENFRFTTEQIAHLEADPLIHETTVEFLRNYKFNGTIVGLAEGDLYFPYTPILTVEGTFADAVILETVLLSILNHDSAVASAAARMVQAADGIPIIEMGSRRTHEIAAVDSARVAYAVGFSHTSNMEAGEKYGVPTTGTSAHAWTLLHNTEKEAFSAQIAALGVSTTLLVDTYDIEQGIRNAVEVAGTDLGGVRIDSGDLIEETVKARALLDSLGAVNTKIVVSSDIDEYSITEMVAAGAPINGVGAGTRVVTGSGHPTAGMVYKIVSRDEQGVMVPVAKKASGKNSVGGFKHTFRTFKTREDGTREMIGEFYTVDGEIPTDAVPTQVTFVRDGVFTARETLDGIRKFHAETVATLPVDALLTTDGEAAFSAENID